MNILQNIQKAFEHRQMPKMFLLPEQMAKHECDDLVKFIGAHWSTMTCDQVEMHFEAIYWFTPEGFCYYLPGILSAGIREDQPELIVYHSIVNMLDRSPNQSLWDKFFLDRWTMLTPSECEVTQEWLMWLSDIPNTSYSEQSLSRAFDTLELLKDG